jgi:hypothetical protein
MEIICGMPAAGTKGASLRCEEGRCGGKFIGRTTDITAAASVANKKM